MVPSTYIGQNAVQEAWGAYIDQLINNEANYKIFIPVDIKGYQEFKYNVLLDAVRK